MIVNGQIDYKNGQIWNCLSLNSQKLKPKMAKCIMLPIPNIGATGDVVVHKHSPILVRKTLENTLVKI